MDAKDYPQNVKRNINTFISYITSVTKKQNQMKHYI